METRLLPGGERAGLPEIVRAGERGVAAEINFAAGREPAEIVTVAGFYQEGGFGVVHLDGDGLHPLVRCGSGEHADAGGVAAVGLGGEGVDDSDGLGHGLRVNQRVGRLE